MRTLLLSLLGLAFVIGIIFSLVFVFYPHWSYFKAIEEGSESKYLNIKACKGRPICNGGEYQLKKGRVLIKEYSSRWRSFHLANYMIPLPIKYEWTYVPIFKDIPGKLQVGMKLLDIKGKEVVSFYTGGIQNFYLPINEQKLFQLPLFKNYILKMDMRKIWRDLFHLKLGNSFKMNMNSVLQLYRKIYLDIKNNKQKVYQNLVYNLFIIHMRNKLFQDKNLVSISFKTDQGIGVQDLKYPNKRYRLEKIYILNKGVINTFILRSRKLSSDAEVFRRKIISGLRYKTSDADEIDKIYNEYNTLDYRAQIGREGMLYLLSAWTQDIKNKKSLEELLKFAGRGQSNYDLLKPIYEYGLKQFGATFSIRSEQEPEKMTIKSKDKVDEENGAEKNNPRKVKEFKSDQEKIEYYLRKAKEKSEAD